MTFVSVYLITVAWIFTLLFLAVRFEKVWYADIFVLMLTIACFPVPIIGMLVNAYKRKNKQLY